MIMSSIFTQIINREIPANIEYENDAFLVIHDINPAAPIHLLIIPKKEIVNIQDLNKEDMPMISQVFTIAQELATKHKVENGYRLVANNGKDAGQTVFHLHFHFLAGQKMSSHL